MFCIIFLYFILSVVLSVYILLFFFLFLYFLFIFFFFFFFQAEDGIRDADVTGVQTCALPILSIANSCNIPATAQSVVLNATVVPNEPMQYLTLWPEGEDRPTVSTLNASDGRSEERRVGKECRSRRSREA